MKQLVASPLTEVTQNAPLYSIIVTPEFGRGLYASNLILPGEVVMVCELLVFSAEDTIRVNQTELQFYTFKYTENQDCLCLGLGEIFNHDDNANVSYKLEDFDGRKVMVFTATQFINAGSQLFINYSADTQVNVDGYINQQSMIG